MRKPGPKPRLHLFVCANRRTSNDEATNPLGPGCSGHGDALYDALKDQVQARGLVASVWITKTHCLGICPKQGATVARYASEEGAILTEVTPDDVASLLSSSDDGETQSTNTLPVDDVMRELDALSDLQRKKVLDLARRLKPGLTLEDVQNPHDFPELDDPDWHYADGVLTGIDSVRSALAALGRQRQS